MFHYPIYRSTRLEEIRRVVECFPLALIVSRAGEQWAASHIPLFWHSEGAERLIGHVDVANPQFDVERPLPVYVTFLGPSGFIPPEAYVSRQLPTWNYVSVHIEGTLTVERETGRNLETLRETAVRLSGTPTHFRVEDEDPRIQRWIQSIRGVSIEVERFEGRFKLSQDKSPADVEAAASYLIQENARRLPLELLLELAGLPPPAKGHR